MEESLQPNSEKISNQKSGLSELTNQLQIARARNDAKTVEISRLERQLRILAELQGISVADLRKALEDACANEAFGEMRQRVAKLKAELEAATLFKRAEILQDMPKGVNGVPNITNSKLLEEMQALKAEVERKDTELKEKDKVISAMVLDHENLLKKKNDEIRKISRDYQIAMLSMVEKDERISNSQEALKMEREKSYRKLKNFQNNEQSNDHLVREMSQQLESLYAAFGVINEDHDKERKQRASVESNLTRADYAFAQQLGRPQTNNTNLVAELQNKADWGTLNQEAYNESSPEDMIAIQRVLREEEEEERVARQFAMATAEQIPALHRPAATAPRSTQNFFSMSGTLQIRSKGMVKKWKTKYCSLYQSGSGHIFDLGEGKTFSIENGVSTVDFNPNHPLSFILSINKFLANAPVIHAAASTEDDYHRWMEVLYMVTTVGTR